MRAVSVLRVSQIQDELAAVVKKDGVVFPFEACENEIELLSIVGDGTEVDIIILYTLVLSTPLETILEQLRQLTRTARIVLIEARDKPVRLTSEELGQYLVYDVIAENKRLDLTEAAKAIRKGPLDESGVTESEVPEEELVTEPPSPDQTQEITVDIPEDERYPSEQEYEPEPEDEPEPEPEIPPSLPEPEPEEIPQIVSEEAPRSPAAPVTRHYRPKAYLKHILIGVFGIAHGAGCTSMASTLAEFFALCGFAAAAIDVTGTSSLALAKGKAEYRTGSCEDARELARTFDFVIVDLGVIYNINVNGQFLGLSPGYTQGQAELLQRCNFKICMGFLDEIWQVKRVRKLLKNSTWQEMMDSNFIFLFNTPPELDEMREVYMYDRNDSRLGAIMCEIFFIEDG